MLYLHKHSACTLLPLVTPPPGFVADAKFSTQTFFPALAYPAAASKVLFLETIVLHAKFLFSGTTISFASRYSFWFCMEACMDCYRLGLLFINFTESSKIFMFFSFPNMGWSSFQFHLVGTIMFSYVKYISYYSAELDVTFNKNISFFHHMLCIFKNLYIHFPSVHVLFPFYYSCEYLLSFHLVM